MVVTLQSGPLRGVPLKDGKSPFRFFSNAAVTQGFCKDEQQYGSKTLPTCDRRVAVARTLFERATPKVKTEVANVRVLFALEIFIRFFCK